MYEEIGREIDGGSAIEGGGRRGHQKAFWKKREREGEGEGEERGGNDMVMTDGFKEVRRRTKPEQEDASTRL